MTKEAGMNFVHASDFHLGYVQYNLKERFKDFAYAFDQVADYTIHSNAEFLLIAGDLFHKRNINAPTYLQAFKILQKLKDHEIPVYVIEGNHDLAYHRDVNSWLQILGAQGLLRLILIKGIEDCGVKLMGDFVDHCGTRSTHTTRIFGIRYLGSQTRSTIPDIAKEIAAINDRCGTPDYTILMMHFGMEGVISTSDIGELSYNSLLPLRDVVDYLALGHYHIQYDRDGWIFNGGSCEMVSISEHNKPKGFYHVVDGKATFRNVKSRPVERFGIDVSGILSLQDLYSSIRSVVEGVPASRGGKDGGTEPLVDISLHGDLMFPRTDVSVEKIRGIVSEHLNPIWVNVKILNTKEPTSVDDRSDISRSEIERSVIEEMVRGTQHRTHLNDVVDTVIEAKQLAVTGTDPQTILERLQGSFDTVRGGNRGQTGQTDLPFGRGGADSTGDLDVD
ncbi:MAG: exonuclease SbcCD subunit D [Euryarchaeota archaeon]|nr:exonuclease SbcCD subunit D [Euryarchaeota archaeon]